jgi:L-cysteine/cystine lyase
LTFEEARGQYPVLERLAYLQAGSAGPLSRAAAEAVAGQRDLDLVGGRGSGDYIERMMAARGRVRALFAAEIGVPPEQMALTRATTDGCNIVVNGLGLGPGDEVVTTDSEHFGLIGALGVSGARVVVAPPDTEALLAAVGPRTRLIAVSHVLWTTGRVLPLAELKRETGLPLLVDGAQSVGAVPVDAEPFDFYTVSGQKWLCCPDSCGALYVREPEALAITFPSSFSQTAYERDGSFTPREGADRFDNGWIAPGLLAGIEAALAVHPAWRFERAREMAERCRALLAEHGVDVVEEEDRATLVAFRPVAGEPKDVVARAYERGVVIREIPNTGLLRASCGYWTNDDDLERLAAAVSAS